MHVIYIRKKIMMARMKKIVTELSEDQKVSGERKRLVVVAAVARTAASAAASTAVTSSCELVGSRIPSVPAVAVVKTALILGIAREERVAAPPLVLGR